MSVCFTKENTVRWSLYFYKYYRLILISLCSLLISIKYETGWIQKCSVNVFFIILQKHNYEHEFVCKFIVLSSQYSAI